MKNAPAHPPRLIAVLPTRVRRNYRGGRELDRLAGHPAPKDSDQPENWLASTLRATNPDLPPIEDEGLTRVRSGEEITTLRELLALAPEFYLGAQHLDQLGQQLGFLAKLLDSSMRLHVQVHPTSQFAREHMNAPYGKLEVYYVLGVREGCEGYIRMGFQRSPGRERWRAIVEHQDISAMDACFDKIPVKKGDVWRVPGGLPHAIGEGVLMVEIMEPSDLVVRCEFEREGVVLPPNSRYMGRDLDFCLNVFDYQSYPSDEVIKQHRIEPKPLIAAPGWSYDQLISPQDTSCFEVFRLRASTSGALAADNRCSLYIQVEGTGNLCAGEETILLTPGSACFVAANTQLTYQPANAASELLCCKPILTQQPGEQAHE